MLFTKEKKQVGIVFDVGTASVSATLFEVGGVDGRPSVIKSFRRFHKASLRHDSSHFSKSTTKRFAEILADIEDATKDAPPSFYVIGLSSIFYLSKTEKLYEKRGENKLVTKTDIETFLENGKKKFLSGLDRDDVEVFETIPMRALLNGYLADQPVGKEAKEIEISVHYSATSKELFNALTAVIWSIHRSANIRFSTFPISTWHVMRELLSPIHSAVVVDIGGELTEVTYMIDGVIEEILSLPFGVLNVLMRISESEHVDLPNALSKLRGYTSGMLGKDADDRLRAILKKEMRSWQEIFDRVWQKASRNTMSDIKIFFLGGGALVSDMKNAVTPPLLHPGLAKNLQVTVIAPEAFKDKFEKYCCFEGPGDFGLMSLILSSRSN
jgi:hypothetical protein